VLIHLPCNAAISNSPSTTSMTMSQMMIHSSRVPFAFSSSWLTAAMSDSSTPSRWFNTSVKGLPDVARHVTDTQFDTLLRNHIGAEQTEIESKI
jgi:hypothetical protein